MEVELISLGARINSIKYNNREIVPGFTSDSTATANLTGMYLYIAGFNFQNSKNYQSSLVESFNKNPPIFVQVLKL